MSDDSAQRLVGVAVGLSAICFAAIGVLLLFAPAEVGGALTPHADGGPLVQLLGAALLGVGAMNWIARRTVLGGIYGRAVVAGNQTHLTIGALLLVKHGFVAGGSPEYWILTGVYVLGAALFLYLFFFSSGIPRRASATLLILGTLSLLPAATSARTQPPPRAVEPLITGGPRAWALATTALLTFRNGDRIDMLSPDARDSSSVAQTRSLLHDWWGIDNRSDLLEDLEWLNVGGHRAEFQRMGQSLLVMTDAQYRASLYTARDRPDLVRRMKLAREHYPKYRRNSLVAWDYGRHIMLCRWGYMVGFLSEDQAWRRIMPAARTIQGSFRSWAEFGDDYLAGREYWSREETERTGRIYRDIEAALAKEPRSVWNQLPWRMDLGPDPKRGMKP